VNNRGPTNRGYQAFFFTLLTIVLASGCTSSRKGEAIAPSPAKARSILSAAYEPLQRIEGSYTLTLNSPDYRATIFGILRLQHPGRLYSKLMGPFGIKLGELTIRDDNFLLKMANGRVEEGMISEMEIEESTGLPLPGEYVMYLFDPSPRPPAREARTVQFEELTESGEWLWRVDEDGIVREILLDPELGIALSESWVDSDGHLLLTKEYQRHELVDGNLVAKRIIIDTAGRRVMNAVIEYEALKLDPEWDEDPFTLLESSQR